MSAAVIFLDHFFGDGVSITIAESEVTNQECLVRGGTMIQQIARQLDL